MEGTLRLHCHDASAAESLLAALKADDAGQVELRVEGEELVCHASSNSPMGLQRTIDDIVTCARATGFVRDN